MNLKSHLVAMALAAFVSSPVSATAFAASVNIGADNSMMKVAQGNPVTIDGTGSSAVIHVNGVNLAEPIQVTCSRGLSVYPTSLPADVENGELLVTLLNTMPESEGTVVLRSGDYRAEVAVTGLGTPLEVRDLSADPKYTGTARSFSFNRYEGFTPGSSGYTVEFRVKLDKSYDVFDAYGVTPDGGSFKVYVDAQSMGLYNGTARVSISNPAGMAEGGTGSFFNRDGKYHTYRLSVTSDRRVFVYRDGVRVGILRTDDFGHQAQWGVEDGVLTQNLLHNGDFEGEWGVRESDGVFNSIEGWYVDPIDQYNCSYGVPNLEINKELDHYNHAALLQRYNWNDGWGAGTISQIVDVVAGQPYSLTCLAMGGRDLKSGVNMSSLRIEEVQNTRLGVSVPVTNLNTIEEYELHYTPSADCTQLRVILYNERFVDGGGYGSDPQPTYFDQMVMSGMSRVLDQRVGYDRNGVKLEYFTFDASGAYAPAEPVIAADKDMLYLSGVGDTDTVNVWSENLVSSEGVDVSATAGFSVSPSRLEPGVEGQVTVTLSSSLPETDGMVILRSGDTRRYIKVNGVNTLAIKDIKHLAVDGTESLSKFEHGPDHGFTVGDNGYTVEFTLCISRARTGLDVFGVTGGHGAFQAYIESEDVGFFNGSQKISLPNPSTTTNGGKGIFYNQDGQYHTYRFAVAPDGRVFVYRDGIEIAVRRAADFAHQSDWAVADGELKEQLLVNGDFEGEWNRRAVDDMVDMVEGWHVSPIDQYNCTYEVANLEIDHTMDRDNHAMQLQRYNWNDGWSSGTVSQIVDVSPNSTYSLNFLAKGGRDKKSGEYMSSVKLQEVNNPGSGVSIDITNSNEMKAYGTSYTTSGDCRQLKVTMYNERFLNGGGWGSEPEPTYFDNVTLAGISRVLSPKVGFSRHGAKIGYFAYDPSGAYAPLAPGFGDDFSHATVISGEQAIKMNRLADGVSFQGVCQDTTVCIYDSLGNLLESHAGYCDGTPLILAEKEGVYIFVLNSSDSHAAFKTVM